MQLQLQQLQVQQLQQLQVQQLQVQGGRRKEEGGRVRGRGRGKARGHPSRAWGEGGRGRRSCASAPVRQCVSSPVRQCARVPGRTSARAPERQSARAPEWRGGGARGGAPQEGHLPARGGPPQKTENKQHKKNNVLCAEAANMNCPTCKCCSPSASAPVRQCASAPVCQSARAQERRGVRGVRGVV